MATIEARKTSDGKTTYRIKIRIRGFPSQSATFERKTDAKNWAAQTEAAIRKGRYLIRRVLTRLTLRPAQVRRHPVALAWPVHIGGCGERFIFTP